MRQPHPASLAGQTTTFRALQTNVSVEVVGQLLPGLKALVASYEPACPGLPWLHYRLQCTPDALLLRDGVEILEVEDWSDSLGFFERDLCHQLVAGSKGHWLLHGAALSRGQRAIVLVGPSGAGKSTLSLALTARGDSYIADDCVAIARDGSVSGISRPIRLDPGVEPPALPAGFTISSDPPSCSLAERWHTLVHPPADRLARNARLSTIFVLLFAPTERPACVRLSVGEALSALWTHTLRPTPEALQLATALLSQCPCHALITRDIDEACEAIDSVWSPV